MNQFKLLRFSTCIFLILAGSALAGRAVTQEQSQNFMREFNRIEFRKLPIVGDWFEDQDLFRHRVRVFAKWLDQNPIQMFDELREHEPIARMSSIPIRGAKYKNSSAILVMKSADVIEVLDHPEVFSVRHFAEKMSPLGEHMLSVDVSPIHAIEKPWMRKMMPATDMKRIGEMVDRMALISTDLMQVVSEDGKSAKLDVVNALGRRVPILLSGEYFGFPGPDMTTMYRWSHATQEDFFHNLPNQRKLRNRAVKASEEMLAYATDLIEKRKAALKDPATSAQADDVLSRMLKNEKLDTADLTDDRVGINIVATLIAGVETTETVVVQALQELMKRPEQFELAKKAALANDDELLRKYVWEALRFHPLNPVMPRYAEKDYVIGKGTSRETKIERGATVLVGTQSAMFDEEVIPNPKAFSIDRPASIYMLFGYGHHRCLGEMVSSVQVPRIIKSLLVKKNLRIVPSKAPRKVPAFPEDFWVEYDL